MRVDNQQRIDEILGAARRAMAAARAVERDAARVTVTATSRGREVAVTVSLAGRGNRVRIDPDALPELSADELEKLILDALRAAQDAAAQELRRRRVKAGARPADLAEPPEPGLRGR